jgi:hypothetical protein
MKKLRMKKNNIQCINAKREELAEVAIEILPLSLHCVSLTLTTASAFRAIQSTN